MKTPAKILIVAALAVTVIAAVVLKRSKPASGADNTVQVATATTASPSTAAASPVAKAKLPKLIDLGAGKCIPCKMMKPILDDLKTNYTDHFITEFIDVWENPDSGTRYGIEVIPTQIFYDADGKELFRHVGFIAKQDILDKWRELGVDFGSKPDQRK